MRYTLIILLLLSFAATAQLQKLSSFPLVSPGSSTWIVALQPGCGGYCNVNVPYTAFGGTGTVTSITATAPLTGGTITSSGSIGLGTTGTAGTYGGAAQVPSFTTDIYGRITAVSNYTVTPSITNVTGISGTPSSNTLLFGNYTWSGLQSSNLPTTGTPASYGSATLIPTFTVDAYGRVTSGSNTAMYIPTQITYVAGSNISITSPSVAVVSNPTFTGLLTGTGGVTTPTMTVTGHENVSSPTSVNGVLNINGLFTNIQNSVTPIGLGGTAFGDYECSTNGYAQINVMNHSNGTAASSDYVATNNAGSDNYHYIDFGINSTGWTGSTPFNSYGEAYLYAQDDSLAIGTDSVQPLMFATNDVYRMNIDGSGNYTIYNNNTSGNLDYVNSSGYQVGLGIGTTGQILTVMGGAPAWANMVAPVYTSSVSPSTLTANSPTASLLQPVYWNITALNNSLTIANPTGSWVDMQVLVIKVKDNGSAESLSFGTNFDFGTASTPTTTTAGKRLYLEFMYDGASSKYDYVTGGNNGF